MGRDVGAGRQGAVGRGVGQGGAQGEGVEQGVQGVELG